MSQDETLGGNGKEINCWQDEFISMEGGWLARVMENEEVTMGLVVGEMGE